MMITTIIEEKIKTIPMDFVYLVNEFINDQDILENEHGCVTISIHACYEASKFFTKHPWKNESRTGRIKKNSKKIWKNI